MTSSHFITTAPDKVKDKTTGYKEREYICVCVDGYIKYHF